LTHREKPVTNFADFTCALYRYNEATLQDGLDCGGAYLKFLTHDPAFTPAVGELYQSNPVDPQRLKAPGR
jgi:hypothetical protein